MVHTTITQRRHLCYPNNARSGMFSFWREGVLWCTRSGYTTTIIYILFLILVIILTFILFQILFRKSRIYFSWSALLVKFSLFLALILLFSSTIWGFIIWLNFLNCALTLRISTFLCRIYLRKANTIFLFLLFIVILVFLCNFLK